MARWPLSASSAAQCNTTCGCYEREVCPGLYDASTDSPAVWTCIELLIIAALFWTQGLRPSEILGRLCHRLRVALTGPTEADEASARLLGGQRPGALGVALANLPRLLFVLVAGSAGLLWIGLSSNFLCQPPDLATLTSAEALLTLPVPLLFPGLIEECFWRFMVLPAPGEERPPASARRAVPHGAQDPNASPPVAFAGWGVQRLLALAGLVAYHLDAIHFEPRRAAGLLPPCCMLAHALFLPALLPRTIPVCCVAPHSCNLRRSGAPGCVCCVGC
jgi:hypothetical protein